MEWIKIYETPDNFKAQLILASLQESGIECRLVNKKDSMYVMLGQVELYVLEKDVEKAQSHIKAIEEQE